MNSRRLDQSDITSAGNFLERELLRQLPKVFERKYAPLWMAQQNPYAPFGMGLSGYEEEIEEISSELAGRAKEYVDGSSDIPVVRSSIKTSKFKVHLFAIATQYTIREVLARQASNRSITQRELVDVNKGLMEASHFLGVFGSEGRESDGLFNDSRVPVTVTGYNPNTASWQDHVDFFTGRLAGIQDRNNLTAGTREIIIPNQLHRILVSTYQNGDTGKNPMQAIMDAYGTSAGGTLQGFTVKNECRATNLEQFGVKPVGTNEDRIIFCPANPDAASRAGDAPFHLPTERERADFITIHMLAVSQTMIHYPDEFEYTDIPQALN